MNILMLHPHDLYSSSEPWTIRIKKIAAEFVKNGHSVKLVYFPLDPRKINKKFSKDGIEIISMDRRLGVWRFFKNIFNTIKLARWADIIHFQKCYYYAALPALIAGWVRNKPVHYDWDDWETKIFYYSNPKMRIIGEFINIFEKLIPRITDSVSVSSRQIKKLCIEKGIPPECIFYTHVGADLSLFRPDSNTAGTIRKKYNINNRIVLYVGQLHGGQYAELLIKAAPFILKDGYDVTFLFVGDGYRRRELQDLASKTEVSNSFIFTGHVEHEEIPFYVTDADICVACFEDNDITKCKSPLKIVEYLASGKAIVASNVGEVRNMVGGVGILTEAGNVYSLAEGIKFLLRDDKLRQRLCKESRKRAVTKYNWSVTADNLINTYERIKSGQR